MTIGYARTSTIEQTAGFESQLRELEGVKCQKIFREQTSSVAVCAQLEAALEFMREGAPSQKTFLTPPSALP
ncbi:recombinase family protein [Nitrosovibrio sp. Nv6]|uniref:recombinase family protein n=1 Tax=Nitrosovibrio sp. Nv6 TaxID=1855340 RepID=UPI0008C4F3B3|nr:recombinase family protein [Nitrosovibrio sp. Nv6]SEO99326.1 Resolvase, N terminal domain [Nitrosovibrio sp. Nv6]